MRISEFKGTKKVSEKKISCAGINLVEGRRTLAKVRGLKLSSQFTFFEHVDRLFFSTTEFIRGKTENPVLL